MSQLRRPRWTHVVSATFLGAVFVHSNSLIAQEEGLGFLPPIPPVVESDPARAPEDSSDSVPVPLPIPLPASAPQRIAYSDEWMSHDDGADGRVAEPLMVPPKDVATAIRERQQERESRYRKLTEQLRRIIELQQQQRLREDVRRRAAAAAAAEAIAAARAAAAVQVQEPAPLQLPVPPESTFIESPDQQPPADVQPQELPPPKDSADTDDSAPEIASSASEAVTSDAAVDVSEKPSVKMPDDGPDKLDTIFTTNATSVVEGPVDRIGLADNLYALGETRVALEMYQQVELRHVTTAEAHWVSFQQASCFRKLGKPDEARETYRRLAGKESAGWLSKMARWWLDQMDEREAIEQHISAQAAQLEKTKSSLGGTSAELPGQ